MNVYVLSSTDCNSVDFVYVEGVFASYAAMLQYIYDSFTTLVGSPVERLDVFKTYNDHHFDGDFLDVHGAECKLKYTAHEVVGEHSAKTDKITFNI